MIPDADAKPQLIVVRELSAALGYRVETAGCNGRLLKSQFEKLYAKFLIWSVDDSKACSLRWLTGSDVC